MYYNIIKSMSHVNAYIKVRWITISGSCGSLKNSGLIQFVILSNITITGGLVTVLLESIYLLLL